MTNEAARERAISRRLVTLAATGLIGGSFIHILLGLLTFIALPEASRTDLAIWVFALSAAALSRAGAARIWCRRWSHRTRLGAKLMIASGVLVGLAWGALPLLVFPEADIAARVVVVFVIGGMSLGAMAVSGYYPPAYFALFVPAFLPLIPWFLLSGNSGRVIMGSMLVAFFITMIIMAIRFGRSVRNIVALEFTRDDLLQSLTRTRDTLDSALRGRSDSVAIFDADDRLLIWNDAFASRYSASGGPDPVAGVKFEDLLRQGLAARGRDPEVTDAWFERRLALHRGEEAPFEEMVGGRWYLVRAFRTATGHRAVIHTDVTTLKEREAALRESVASNAAIVDAALDAVIGFDQSGTILSLNEAAEPLFGTSRDDLVGSSLFDRLSSASARAEFIADLDRFARSGESRLMGQRSELSLMRADGKAFPAEISLVHTGGTDARFTAFIRDIGDRLSHEDRLRHSLEELRRSTRAKTEFLATIGHEIRAPLGTLVAAVDRLAESDLPGDASRVATEAAVQGEILKARLGDLMDYADVDAGQIATGPETFDPAALVESMLSAFRSEAERRSLRLEAKIGAAVPKRVSGDAESLRRILFNLVSNAVKFTIQGTVSLELSRLAGDDGFVVLRFLVADSGIGIPAHVHDRIFAPFSLAEPAATRLFGGQGVGLAVARGLVLSMNGRIDFASEVGTGSRFHCDLPFLIAAEAAPVPVASEGGSGQDFRAFTVCWSMTARPTG